MYLLFAQPPFCDCKLGSRLGFTVKTCGVLNLTSSYIYPITEVNQIFVISSKQIIFNKGWLIQNNRSFHNNGCRTCLYVDLTLSCIFPDKSVCHILDIQLCSYENFSSKYFVWFDYAVLNESIFPERTVPL